MKITRWAALAVLLCSCSSSPATQKDASSVSDGMLADQQPVDLSSAETIADGPGTLDTAPDQQVTDLGPDLAPPGSKTMGQHCVETEECQEGMICASGEYTSAHCTPTCTDNTPCIDEANNVAGTCTPVGGFEGNICIFYCGFLANGAECPGDLVCEGGAVCR